jgi:catechol 2,3-dioxygenase-like lactoylglutathione lyase family enzyme
VNETAVMTDLVPIRGLFETHLTVSDLPRSIAFYRDVVGLQLALEVYEGRRFESFDARAMVARHGATGPHSARRV